MPLLPERNFTQAAKAAEDNRTLMLLRLCHERRNVVALTQQFLKLMSDLQQHRGLTTSIIAGNSGFEKQWAQVTLRMDRRLLYIGTWDSVIEHIVPGGMQGVRQEWQVIRADWRDETALQNFELHTHLISKLQQLVRQISRWLGDSHGSSTDARLPRMDRRIFDFTFQSLTGHIENLAMLRGLSAYAMSVGNPGSEQLARMEFLIKNTRLFQREIRAFSADLSAVTLRQLPGLMQAQINEPVFEEWLRAIPVALAGRGGRGGAEALFAQGSSVIEHYTRLEEECIHHIGRLIDERLEKIIQPVP
jgi:hypothetical protein